MCGMTRLVSSAREKDIGWDSAGDGVRAGSGLGDGRNRSKVTDRPTDGQHEGPALGRPFG